MKRVGFVTAALLLLCGGPNASAGSYMTYDLTWSGAPFGNTLSATGHVTLLTSDVVNGFNDYTGSLYDPPDVTAFSITVTGDPNGVSNGTWGIDYYAGMSLTVQGGYPLNPAAPLIGQPGLVDLNFWINAASPFPPNASASPFTLSTFNGSFMTLTGATPTTAVPEPSSISLLGAAAVGIAGYCRRKRTRAAA